MNGRVAKKLRKYARRPTLEYVEALCSWPFRARLRFAWAIVRAKYRKKAQ